MSDYDSDDEVMGGTSVLLGFAGKSVGNNGITALDNHIGGVPIWLNGTKPASDLTTCDACNEPLGLLAQLSCPLDDKLYDRVLYVLGCPKPECRQKSGSIKALRGIHDNEEVCARIRAEIERENPPVVESKKHNVGDMIFGGGSASSNPFGDSSGSNPFETKPKQPDTPEPKQKKPKSKPQPQVKEDENAEKGVWLQKLVEVDEEYLVPEKPVKIEELDSDVMESSTSSGPDSSLDPEVAAIAEAVSDPIFSKFANLVQHNPDQVLRYERPLKIVPYSNDEVYRVLINPSEIPDSEISGGPRIFELQLMPHLISELETDDQLVDGMEWGTIAVATSENDDIPELDSNGVGYVQEWVGVQWELQKV